MSGAAPAVYGMSRRQPCNQMPPHGLKKPRPFAGGWRCDRHTPSALAGRPEPEPGPGLPAGAWSTPSPLNESRVHDARAVASGKRRSSPQTYRAAQAAVSTNSWKGSAA